MIEYIFVATADEYNLAKKLFNEYAKAINIDLTFQKFDKELEQINTMYSPPNGGIIICKKDTKSAGCIAVRKLEETICELKRMYVDPAFQGNGIGKVLLEKALELAKDCQYKLIRLDTLNYMHAAIHLYKQYGFYEIEPYYFNPNKTALFFEKKF